MDELDGHHRNRNRRRLAEQLHDQLREGTVGYYPATVTLSDVKDTAIGPLFSELNAVYQASGGPFGFSTELFALPLPPE